VNATSTINDPLFLAEESQGNLVWRRFRRRKSGVISLITLGVVILSVLLIPLISPIGYDERHSPDVWLAPAGASDPDMGHRFLLGTDYLGRDFFTRLFYAGRASLLVALVPTLAILLIGSTIGLVAGYYVGWVDTLLMHFTDFMLAFPLLPLYLFTSALIRRQFLDPNRFAEKTYLEEVAPIIIVTTILAFTILGWMGLARLVRGQILSLRSRPFVEAAKALGAGNRRIIFKHLLPNTAGPILVAGTAMVGDFLVLEAVMAYVAMGITDPPIPSWGNLIASAQGNIWFITQLNPFQDMRAYSLLLPAFMIFITVLAINYVADALRDALDPGHS
jgi:peptide/nickel transport system permease protein